MYGLAMAHATARSGYDQLIKRLNKHPQGAPPSEILNKILGLLFSEKEAALVALLLTDFAVNLYVLAEPGIVPSPAHTGQPVEVLIG